MAFTYVRNMISGMGPIAPPKDNVTFTERNAGTLAKGQPLKFHTDGKVTGAAAQDLNASLIALEAFAQAGTGRCAYILPGNVYKVPLRQADGTVLTSGTDKSGTVVEGARVRISTNGLAADGENIHHADNPLTIIKMEWDNTSDTTRKEATVWVVFNRTNLVV